MLRKSRLEQELKPLFVPEREVPDKTSSTTRVQRDVFAESKSSSPLKCYFPLCHRNGQLRANPIVYSRFVAVPYRLFLISGEVCGGAR
jgi:hypothetical protein